MSGTFSWSSLKNLRTQLKSSTIVMLATIAVVVGTHNLALGVAVGVLLSSLFFTCRATQVLDNSSSRTKDTGARTGQVRGQLFFVSASTFAEAFDCREVVSKVRIDSSHAHPWDLSSITAGHA